jgi:hypothetical protein
MRSQRTARLAMVLGLALCLALAAPTAAQILPGDDDSAEVVDTAPYVAALVERFRTCLAEEEAQALAEHETAEPAEGEPVAPDAEPAPEAEPATAAPTPTPEPTPSPTPQDDELAVPDVLPELDPEEEIENAMANLAMLLGRNREQGSCTADDDAVLACTAEVATWSCEELYGQLESAISGNVTGQEAPGWATDYAAALGGKVVSCFEEEVGAPATPAQTKDIETWQGILSSSMAGMGSACLLNEERFGECLAGIPLIDCGALAEQIASDASITVSAFLEDCEGFLDCGF